ncbi:MAG TPA: hypothetical protein VGD46_13490 [Rhizobacter sp.]
MHVDILPVDDSFTIVKEKRGIHVVKQYLHRWVDWHGERHFQKFRRKHNRTYIEVAHHQHLVDQMKPLFGLQKIGTHVVYDDKEGYGVMQRWHPVIATVKMRPYMDQWLSEQTKLELFKICVFDGVIGGLDRHGNNVIVLKDGSLLTIDDEDVFYDKLRVWVKFDRDIKRMVYAAAQRQPHYVAAYREHLKKKAALILAVADHPVMHANEQYPFYSILQGNLGRIDEIVDETLRQMLL